MQSHKFLDLREQALKGSEGTKAIMFTSQMLDQASKKGFEELNLHLKKNQRAHIITRRVELANVPGAYNLYTNEYTEGSRYRVDFYP